VVGIGRAVTSAGAMLSGPAYFLDWGVVQISLANFLVIVLMVILFVLALVLPFPHGGRDAAAEPDHDELR
jgi:hypothetical protein